MSDDKRAMSSDDEGSAGEGSAPSQRKTRKLLSFKGRDGGEDRWLALMNACLQTVLAHPRTGKCFWIWTADGRGGRGSTASGKAPTKLDVAQKIATLLNAEDDMFDQQLTAKTVVNQWAVRVSVM